MRVKPHRGFESLPLRRDNLVSDRPECLKKHLKSAIVVTLFKYHVMDLYEIDNRLQTIYKGVQ